MPEPEYRFRHALTREEWRSFLERYQQAFAGPDEAEVDRALQATERLALRMAHLTPNRRRYRELKRRFKRTPGGWQCATCFPPVNDEELYTLPEEVDQKTID